MITVNQTLFAMILFYYLLGINWFMVTNFPDQNVDYLDNHKSDIAENWFLVRNICDNEVLVNRVKIFAHEKKVNLH